MISLLSLHCTPSAISTGTFLYFVENFSCDFEIGWTSTVR